MDRPTTFAPFKAAPDIDVLPSFFPLPGLGMVPVNAFVLNATEPVLVDTGPLTATTEWNPRSEEGYSEARISRADFSGADFSGAILSPASLPP